MRNKIYWTQDMCELLLWMRSENMPVAFCAYVIGLEMGKVLSAKSCEVKHWKLVRGITR